MPRTARGLCDRLIYHVLNRGNGRQQVFRYYGSSGHVWQGRYKSFIVQEDEHLPAVVRYIEGNPVRARLVESAKCWAWSSHGERISGMSGKVLSALPVTLPINWTEYVDTALTGTEALH